MENRSFEDESACGGPPKDPKDNPPGPLNPRTDPSGESRNQQNKRIPPVAQIDDEDNESPPAYVKRYMQQEQKTNDLEDLEPPPPEPAQEPRDVRLSPEFQKQASKRRERRRTQNLVQGPCSLRPESPNHPLPAPEPYPDVGQQVIPEPDQQDVPAPDPGQQVIPEHEPDQQDVHAPDPGQQVIPEPEPDQQDVPVPDPGQQVIPEPEPDQQVIPEPDPDQPEVLEPASPATWREMCASYYRRMQSFTFQFSLHTLLLTWPLATAIMGAVNTGKCHMNGYLPYVMIAVGLLGVATILFRLYVLYFEKRVLDARADVLRNSVLAAETIIWIFFAAQSQDKSTSAAASVSPSYSFVLYLHQPLGTGDLELCYFLLQAPSFTPGDLYYCDWRIYKINCGLMFLTSATMIGWMIVNIVPFIRWVSSRNQRSSS